MINITAKEKCCGCEACVRICPKQCISFNLDTEGFFYPKVDLNLCIQCNLCEKVCPSIHYESEPITPDFYAAKSNDCEILKDSTSGGIFSEICRYVISKKGVICGACFDKNWDVIHDCSEQSYTQFMGSKYVQSRIGDVFVKIRDYLNNNRTVLFSGTPCQVKGLKNFLRRDYDNLITIDFICHGVPSISIWREYLKQWFKDNTFQQQEGNSPGNTDKIINIKFRDKMSGWSSFHLTFNVLHSDKTIFYIYSYKKKNAYLRGFLNDITLRPSCYECQFKNYNSGSDITLGDLWGASDIVDWNVDEGVSAIVINTSKGRKIFENLAITKKNITEANILGQNPSLRKSVKCPPRRKHFFEAISTNKNIIESLNKYSMPPLKDRIRSSIILCLKKLGLLKYFGK